MPSLPTLDPNRPAPRLPSVQPFFLVGVILLAMLMHGLWLAMPLAVSPMGTRAAPPKTYRFLPDDGSRLGLPVLFALPSSTGFSRAALSADRVSQPPLGVAVDLSRPLPSPPAIQPPPPVLGAIRLPALPVTAPPPPPVATGRKPGWSLSFPGGSPVPLRPFRPPPASLRPGPLWQVSGEVEWDEHGLVQHLTLDVPLKDTANAPALLHTLYSLRVLPGSDPGPRRFVLRYREPRP